MELKDIVAISGKPGLYEIKAQSKGGIIVESLIDSKRFPVTVTHNISALNEIAIYTYEEEIPLRIIFKTIGEKENGKEAINPKESGKVLSSYFREVLPNFDEERVYTSNIKKILQWYNILASKNFDFTSIVEEEETEEA
ncbi:MAG: DUF5606 domain-containing protein [Lutibacter sp.]|uniref:DUF5606 family protein n=1 Tax=Lutibacter sp. TaxID=1925666 RepID=UPI0017DECBB7|nr:DUF5606 domain-containing protein [Lutibacter sp.]MBT8316872.1 DUF5606 domain-containing protein [Lutibacter sp.]NNJ57732.1 DUF5606 domain-containing protein [Lutibacter sp.]